MSVDSYTFDHEKLHAYRLAREFAATAYQLAKSLPRGNQNLANQLLRAASSIPLNIAEGAGEFATAEKGRFYRIARRSATECAAILDLVEDRSLVDPAEIAEARKLLFELVRVVTALAKAHTLAAPGQRGKRNQGGG